MKKKYNKNIFKVLIVIGVILLIILFSLIWPVNSNKDYLEDLFRDIVSNYEIDGKVDYVNIYGGYYIIKTKDKVVVLDKEYKEVFVESNSKLVDNKNNYDLVYRNNSLMYEDAIVKDEEITYNYYDVYTYKFITSIIIG